VSPDDSRELILDAYNLLNENGLLYLSFVEGDPAMSEFKAGSGGRVYFQYHQLADLKTHLQKAQFKEIETFRVKYETGGGKFDIHTILTAKKKIVQ
jgi:hypothetical protein